jgi:hypothetical protein
MTERTTAQNPMARVMGLRDFRLLIAAGALDVLVAVWTAFQPGLRALSERMVSEAAAQPTPEA